MRPPQGEAINFRPAGQNAYVLPGAERRWHPAPGSAKIGTGAALRLTAVTQAGPMEQTLAVQ